MRIPLLILFGKVQLHHGPSENGTPGFLDAPQIGEDFPKLLYICNPWFPTDPDTTSSEVPRADLVSRSGSQLPLLGCWAGSWSCIRCFVLHLLPGLKQTLFPWMQSWKNICLRCPKAIMIRPASMKTFKSVCNKYFPPPFEGFSFLRTPLLTASSP